MSELQLSSEQLNKLGYPLIQEMKDSSNTQINDYISMFDPTRAVTKKFEELMLKIMLDGQLLEVAEDFHMTERLIVGAVLRTVIQLTVEAQGD